jgi:uncharacterized protein YbjT (DUF2867 family)
MQKVILFGATGNLGKEIARELISHGYDLTVVARNESRAESLSDITRQYIIADVCDPGSLGHILDNQDIVISALGKSVSPNDRSKPTFEDVDYWGNVNILNEAKKSGVKKFIYVSAFHSEKFLHLTYFKVHHEFSELLKLSGIDYSIIKPPAIFSAFIDMIEMARKGQLVNIGEGDKKTNPIYEGDLAKIVADSISSSNSTIEAGGQTIYTRKQINEIVQNAADGKRKVRSVPMGLFKVMLPILKLVNKNMYDKFAFFIEVMQHDTIAPRVGKMTFEDYIKLRTERK